jgi:hypothetical protein
MEWTGALILQSKIAVKGLSEGTCPRRTWPAEWVDSRYGMFGFPLNQPTADEWTKQVRDMLDDMFEKRDAKLQKPFVFLSPDGGHKALIQPLAAPAGSMFSARTVKLLQVTIEGA